VRNSTNWVRLPEKTGALSHRHPTIRSDGGMNTVFANQATIATGVALMVGAGLVLSNPLRDLGAREPSHDTWLRGLAARRS